MQKRKEYKKPFKLDETKLTSIVGVLRSRLSEASSGNYVERFEAFSSATARDDLSSLDALMALENSRKHSVERLLISASSTSMNDPAHRREIQVDFSTEATLGDPSDRKDKIVAITVTGDASSWTSLTLAAVEEQVERTWQQGLLPSMVALMALMIGILGILISPYWSWSTERFGADTLWLTAPDLARAKARLAQDMPLSDQELRDLTALQLRNVIRANQPDSAAAKKKSDGSQLLIYPLVFVVFCAAILIWKCYPKAVFYWGDGKEHFDTLLKFRNTLWTLIASITLLAVLGNMLSAGVMARFFGE